ncbi:hypothetical protein [Streptomyces sp. AA0539]|uniref:hypothetical protein n=1 Tax=Streptomyces sp. AA0539 TaxID=1210045 RepID=UPI003FCF4D1C
MIYLLQSWASAEALFGRDTAGELGAITTTPWSWPAPTTPSSSPNSANSAVTIRLQDRRHP